MKKLLLFIPVLFLVSCGEKPIKHSGLNDELGRRQHFNLYDDRTFFLEISEETTDGTYEIKGDTVFLEYANKPSPKWPDAFLLRPDYFESVDEDIATPIRIRRFK